MLRCVYLLQVLLYSVLVVFYALPSRHHVPPTRMLYRYRHAAGATFYRNEKFWVFWLRVNGWLAALLGIFIWLVGVRDEGIFLLVSLVYRSIR